MGTYIIKMPDIGEGIAEVELVEWHVGVGDDIIEDQVLADVMTDKATVEVPSPVHGRVLTLGGKIGETMAVGSALIYIEVEGEGNATEFERASSRGRRAGQWPREQEADAPEAAGDAADLADAAPIDREPDSDDAGTVSRRPPHDREDGADASPRHDGGQPDTARVSRSERGSRRGARPSGPARPLGQRALASPAVRRRAWDLGITLQYVPGSGPGGRITHGDLDAWLARDQNDTSQRTTGSLYDAHDEETTVPVRGLRRLIARKMQESKRRIPHFTYVEEIDVTELEGLRARLNARYSTERGKLTLLPFLARAMVLALRRFPQINARFDDDADVVTQFGAVHLGVAAQTPAGLMVPVVHHAETLDLWSCAAEIARLAEAARQGKAARDELTGSTITITSLGPLGGIVSTPVINHPEVAIVGVNRVMERPVFREGRVEARRVMNLSSSFDHRVVDGLHAAEFIQEIRHFLECPALLFVE